VYQSVLSSDVLATTTSLRMPSTSCAYHSGKVSLSPTVTSTPYGSTELSRSRAKSIVSVWPARDAVDQLVKSGIKATARTGAAERERAVCRPLDGLAADCDPLAPDERGDRVPCRNEPQRGPHAPRREAPEIEVVAVAYLARHAGEIGRLRSAVLEVQVVDEHEGHREHQRPEIRETSSVPLPVDVAAEQGRARGTARASTLCQRTFS